MIYSSVDWFFIKMFGIGFAVTVKGGGCGISGSLISNSFGATCSLYLKIENKSDLS